MPSTLPSTHSFLPAELGPCAAGFFQEHGFLVVKDALDKGELAELVAETVALCRGQRGGFLQDGNLTYPISNPEAYSDEDIQKAFLCIHHPHKSSPVLAKYLSQQILLKALTLVMGPNIKCMQSMLFIKSSGKPGQAWHQDEDFIPTRDRSLAGAWIAIDDATLENGCLWIIPGSHKPGILWPMHAHTDKRFDCARESFGFPYTDQDSIPVEVTAGSIVFFNGYTLHRSLPNTARRGFRRVLVNHYMNAESFLPWRHQEGLPMAQQDYRDIVMVAGTDPYAYKGTNDIAQASIRPDGQGGCSDGRKLV